MNVYAISAVTLFIENMERSCNLPLPIRLNAPIAKAKRTNLQSDNVDTLMVAYV